MKKISLTLAALFALGGSIAAHAQTPASAPAAATPSSAAATHAARHEARVEERITYLHKQLKITSEQEAQWKPFADTMRDNGETMANLYAQRMDAKGSATALDDVKQYAEIAQANADGAKKLVDSFGPLYDALSPAQKAIADKTFAQRWNHHGPRDAKHAPHKAAKKPAAPAADAASAPAAQ
ncbi:Spy/CpxP family protein refolding chaperone [Burkholderia sp. Ac-20379]|uniref:Spy/CpxP family protein refolding chaperone n=1 Tax=Burkholderia sp. Ac-20379 TaxID=2703900 RepID=UPI001981CDD3|nr:Spy/CpxP family protein refolding chaperone [Burkholderia sp. Ac-20379]MBN3726353.1 Spy/CpxP family protein refolding chaperone [Burkholderia sp. Ac-20379]